MRGTTWDKPRRLRCQPGYSLWTQLTVKARVPGNAAAVLVLLETKDDQGTAWFDSVNVGPDGDNDVTT